jgi:hypothetical protein
VPLSVEEVARFGSSFRTAPDRAIVGGRWWQGLRSQQVLDLNRDDLLRPEAQIRVRGQGNLTFDGKGTFTATLTFNTDGMISHPTDTGPSNVNADCTGQLITSGGTRTVDIVIVDGGKEFYQLRTNPPPILFQFNSAKKQIPDDNQQ